MRPDSCRRLCVSTVLLPLVACVQANPPAIDRGIVLAAQPVDMADENLGVGGVVGAVGGGVAGGQIGRASGQVAAVVVGAVAGEIAGTAAESALQDKSGLQYTLRLDDGRVVTIVQHRDRQDPVLASGQRVMVSTSGRKQRVVAEDGGSPIP